jgi:hypothetical protein
MRALLRGARFVTVNVDRAYVGPDGDLVPASAAESVDPPEHVLPSVADLPGSLDHST